MRACMRACMIMHACMLMHDHACMLMHACMRAVMHACMRICIYVDEERGVYTYTHVCMLFLYACM